MSERALSTRCPFCDGEGYMMLDDSSDYERHWRYFGLCGECDAETGHYATEAEAEAAWNRRVPAPAGAPVEVQHIVRRWLDDFADFPDIDNSRPAVRAWLDAQLQGAPLSID